METQLTEILKFKGSHVCSVEPEASVAEAADKMKRERVGALLVMHKGKTVGIFTERDALYRVVAAGLDPKTTSVHKVMTSNMVVVKPTITIREAMQIITEKRTRHLPVFEGDELAGMVSSGDLTRWIVSEEEGYIETLMDYISGKYPG